MNQFDRQIDSNRE